MISGPARGDGGSEARPQPLLTISGVDSPRTCGPGIASLWREGLVTDCSSQCPLQENPLRRDKPIFGMDNETDLSFNTVF